MFPGSSGCNSMSPFSNNWGGDRYRTVGKVPVLERGHLCTGLHPQMPASVHSTEENRDPWASAAQCQALCQSLWLLWRGPAAQSARSPSQHGINTCSRRLVKTYNRIIISAHFHQKHHSTLKPYSSLLRTMIFSLTQLK